MNGHTLFDELSDPNHPLRLREWNTFLERRQILYDDLVAKLGLSAATSGIQFPIDPVRGVDSLAITSGIERMRMADELASQKPPDMRERDYQQVLGNAILYGIPNPESVPFGELQQMIEQRRIRRRGGEEDFDGLFEDVSLTPVGPVFIGAVDALVRSAETLPFLGDFLSNRESTQALNRWIGQVREASTGALDERELQGAQIQETIGNIVGYIAPGILAWRLAGLALGAARLGGITRASQIVRGREIVQTPARTWGLAQRNPITFNAIQGGVASWLLEGGGDGPIEERALNIALGTGLGAAFGMGGPVAAAAFGGTVGGIIGASADEPLAGIALGIGAGLGLHRAYRGFSRNSGLNRSSQSTWFEVTNDASTPLQIAPGNVTRAPRVDIPPRGLPPGTGPRTAIEAAPSRLELPSVAETSAAMERFTWRGTRNLFYYGDEAPDVLVQRWTNLNEGGLAGNDGFTNNIPLDNTGRIPQGVANVHEVEARFNNLFVLTPESAQTFNSLIGQAQSLQQIQTALRQRGFDGLAVQGIDDVINQVGDVQETMRLLNLPWHVMQDQVIAFGTPYQVRYSRPIIDGDMMEDAATNFGGEAMRQVAGVQSANFARESGRQLRPFEVGALRDQLGPPPTWLSENRGLMFLRTANTRTAPEFPSFIESVVVQNHETLGPRLVLLDADRMSHATIPLNSFEEGLDAISRLGFEPLTPNTTEQAQRLAFSMTHGDLFVNNSLVNVLGQVDNPSIADLVGISAAENPGRVSLISDIGDPFELKNSLAIINERYGLELDFDRDMFIVERPSGVFHALIGDRDLLESGAGRQFKEFGVFSGMEAGTVGGSTVRVNSVWREKSGRARASISPIFSDIKATVPLDYIIPGRTSVQQPLTGDVYKKFTQYALNRFNNDAARSGLEPATELADPRVLSFIDKYIDGYGTELGFNLHDLGRFSDSLEWNLAQDIRRLAGEDGELFESMLMEQAAEITKATMKGDFILPDLEELALSQGFIWEPPFAGRHGQLVDQTSNTIIPFLTRDSAEAFLRNFNRSRLDYNVGEKAQMSAFSHFDSFAEKSVDGVEFPTEADQIRSTEGTIIDGEADLDKFIQDTEEFVAVANALDAGAGGTVPPPPPPSQPGSVSPPPDDPINAIVQRAGDAIVQSKARAAPPTPTETMLRQISTAFGRRPDRVKDLLELIHRPHIRMLAPVRVAAQIFEEHLNRLGVERLTLHRDLSAVLDSKSIATNEAAPWINQLWDIVNKFNRGDRRRGPLYDVLTASTAPDQSLMNATGYADQRALMMDKYEFTAEQRAAVDELRDFLNRLHSEAASFDPSIGFIMDYLPRLRYFLDLHGDKGWRKWEDMLPQNLKWFALYGRDGNLQAYHKDVGRVLETYIRGLFFEKHSRVPFERARATWTADKRVPEPLRDYVGNFLYVARHGHPPGHDAAIQTMTSGFNAVASRVGVPKIHEGELLNSLGAVSTLQYRNLIGLKPATMLREFYQPMLNGAEIGIFPMMGAYRKFLTDPNVRREWTERALRYGWAEPNRNAVANAEFFTGELRDIQGISAFDEATTASREAWASRWDVVYDRLPNSLKNGIEGNPWLDPLYSYRNYVTNPGRIIAANASFEKASNAIIRYESGEITWAEMLRESGAINQAWSVKQEFVENVLAGNFEEAARTIGSQGAATQFWFGAAEQSESIRNAGIVGRLALQFGNFSNQLGWRVGRQLSNRAWPDKFAYLARLGVLALLPGTIGLAIGWREMNRFNWFRSWTFSGGPIVDPVVNAFYAFSGARKVISGDSMSPEEQFAMGRFRDQLSDFGMTLFPTGHLGGLQTIGRYFDALTSEDPVEATFRVTITGESRPGGRDRFLDNTLPQQIQEAAQAQQDATRLNRPRPSDLSITPEEWNRFLQMIDSIAATGGGGAR